MVNSRSVTDGSAVERSIFADLPKDNLIQVYHYHLYGLLSEGKVTEVVNRLSEQNSEMRQAYNLISLENIKLLHDIQKGDEDAAEYLEHPESFIREYSVEFMNQYREFCRSRHSINGLIGIANDRSNPLRPFAIRQMIEVSLSDRNWMTSEKTIIQFRLLLRPTKMVYKALVQVAQEAPVWRNRAAALARLVEKLPNNPELIALFRQSATIGEHMMERKRAIEALASPAVVNTEIIEFLEVVAMNDNEEFIRKHVLGLVLGLDDLPDNRKMGLLLWRSQNDPSWVVRHAAIEYLGELGVNTPQVLAALQQAATNDPSQLINRTAERLLQELAPFD